MAYYFIPTMPAELQTTRAARHIPQLAFILINHKSERTGFLVSNCSQSAEPVGRIPIVEHLYRPNAKLEDIKW
jgi:hypothetical protein